LHLGASEQDTDRLAAILCGTERARAARFGFELDRRRFIQRRSSLRRILSTYLGRGPGQLRYRLGPFGKPELAGPAGSEWLRFNIARSADRLMVIIGRGREVGVDIELVRPMPDLQLMAGDVLSRPEMEIFHRLGEAERLKSFFSVWTQKEAYLKARGLGLSRPPPDVEVGMTPAQPAGLRRDSRDPTATELWSVIACDPSEDVAAAVSAEGEISRITQLGDDVFARLRME
jgi:4'-phosphopantetheinyl transferase